MKMWEVILLVMVAMWLGASIGYVIAMLMDRITKRMKGGTDGDNSSE